MSSLDLRHAPPTAKLKVCGYCMRSSARRTTVAIEHRPLSHPIGDRRDAKDALLAVVLWNADSAAVAEVGTGRKEIYERTHLSGEVITTRINCVQRRSEHDLLG